MSSARLSTKGPAKPILSDWYLRSRLKMRQILLLAALDEHRNMHRAAASVSITQPAATRLLADLERLLGLRLFERSARGVTPNAYGETLVRYARVVLATLDHARDDINALASGTEGKIALGALLVTVPVLVPRAVARFKERYPNYTVLIREGTSAALAPRLQRGELDLIVGRASSDLASERVKFEAFYSEPMEVVARPRHPRAHRRGTRLAQLAGEQWIVPTPETAYRRRFEAAFKQAGVEPPRRIVESTSVLTNIALVRETEMLAVMPRDVTQQYSDMGLVRTVAVRLPAPSGPVGVVTVLGKTLLPAALDLIEALRQVAGELKRRA